MAKAKTTTIYFAPKTDTKEGSPTKGQPKETKNTVVFDEVNEDGSAKEFDIVIGQLYVTKAHLRADRPKLIKVTFEH